MSTHKVADGKEDRFHDEPHVAFSDFAPEAVDFAKGLDDEYLDCRVYRHNWVIGHSDRILAAGAFRGGRVRLLQCDRCGSARADFLTPVVGRVWYRKYFYPDGYTFKGAQAAGGLDRDLILMERTARQPTGNFEVEDPELAVWLIEVTDRLGLGGI